ncbi:unnamed protein product [Arctogadus glacialis]
MACWICLAISTFFCCHYVFIPRLQARLDEFRDGWDNHPLSTEGNRTPNQLWFLGQYHSSEDQVDEVHICQMIFVNIILQLL